MVAASNEARVLPRWLAIGNSITQHGPSERLSWFGENRGMAASSVATDYVHVLRSKLQASHAENATDLKIAGRLSKLSAGTIEAMHTVLSDFQTWRPDLVTIQLGENDRLNEIGGEDEFEKRYRVLVDALLQIPNPPLIICTGVWTPSTPADSADSKRYEPGSEARIKDDIIERICKDKGLHFVSITPIATTAGTAGWGDHPGVRWHPNDSGMEGYAEAIFSVIQDALD